MASNTTTSYDPMLGNKPAPASTNVITPQSASYLPNQSATTVAASNAKAGQYGSGTGQLKYYSTVVNGNKVYVSNPDYGNTPYGYTPVSQAEYNQNKGLPPPTAAPNTQTPPVPPPVPPPAPGATTGSPINTSKPSASTVQINPANNSATNTTTNVANNTQNYQSTLSKLSGTPAPATQGEASSAIASAMPANQPPQPQADPVKTDAVLASDKAHQQYINDYKDSQSSQGQTESLTKTYSDLSNQLGLPALNTQLMNMKNIMDGSEQDIRNEITKAGGFATESQVMALTSARNKTMLQNYNTLLQTRDDAQKNLDTMIGLTKEDRAYAQQQINDKLNFDQQNITYTDKAVSNAQNAYKTMQSTEGWDGILKAALASGDPQAVAKINSTMGPGFDLTSMAKQDAKDRATATTKSNLELAQASANLKKTNAEAQKLNEDNGVPNPAKANAPGFNANGVKYTNSSATTELQNEIKSQGLTGDRHLLAPADYNQMKSWWVLQNLNATDFENVFGGYKDTGKAKSQYN